MYNEPVYIQRTPSDVPRTAELIEMSTGPGKTVTEYDKFRVLNCLNTKSLLALGSNKLKFNSFIISLYFK